MISVSYLFELDTSNFTREEKRQYREGARKFHPDFNGGKDEEMKKHNSRWEQFAHAKKSGYNKSFDDYAAEQKAKNNNLLVLSNNLLERINLVLSNKRQILVMVTLIIKDKILERINLVLSNKRQILVMVTLIIKDKILEQINLVLRKTQIHKVLILNRTLEQQIKNKAQINNLLLE